MSSGRTVQHLDDPSHDDNTRATKVRATETVDVARVGGLDLLHLVSVLHERERGRHALVRVVALAREAAQRLLRVVDAAPADQVPRALGRQEADEEQGRDPHPLKAVGDAPARVAGQVEGAAEHAGGKEAAGAPAHGDPGRQVAAHGGGADLGGVGGGEGLEDALLCWLVILSGSEVGRWHEPRGYRR